MAALLEYLDFCSFHFEAVASVASMVATPLKQHADFEIISELQV